MGLVDSVTWSNPLPFYIPFWPKKLPLSYTFFDKWYPLFMLFLYFVTQNVQTKKEKIKIHYRTKLARKPLIETTELIT